MRKSMKMKLGAVGTTIALAGALAVVASGTTGAYFSETKTGGITGTIGSVRLSTSETSFNWNNMMPGVQKSATVDFTNIGSGPQDFYLTFPNRLALHKFNNAGKYGEVHIVAGGAPIFDSANLNDGRRVSETGNTCGAFSPDPGQCWPLPTMLKVATNLAPDASGSFTFSFNYPSSIGNTWQGGTFNAYPASEGTGADVVGPAGNGLPFNVVAVQVGQTP